ncbi:MULTISPECIES: hypothetical protein [Bradyrhizobium]|jgi:hypothetical protein|uniref:Uncharacterized protein n=1 Tax=Bradyrhizobium diazoefficiens TaxID=1355477 RepID=A0A809XNS9_9BRAD|nr:hypothetical protein [Bradyrhizobium diazoefficiens]MBP1059982.1 hypothetical protein [Bradyrhizobium japonicum]QJS40815.1 hypothetical protein DI395_45315 [Bradyrhizobium diazoefficiens]WLB37793.1 hypothetical protein QIH78_41725 [Bradyrhizobium diazoefficiens]BCE27578.1 hypothetical protein XF2B_13470 [Bradyrhizobium diazoefficiens]BCE71265.1 hypothetical protein XF8B_13760 [Bradyrhizobium diazoefficiens]
MPSTNPFSASENGAYSFLASFELIDDREELAHHLWESGLCPHDHPRIEALYRRAASGKGPYAQMLSASGMI